MKNINNLVFILGIVLLIGLPIYLITGEASEHIPQAQKFAAYITLAALLVGSYILLQDDNALRDSSELIQNKPYSFSRVQMWWWTMIILGSFIGVYAVSGNLWPINATCLVLLGISCVTTAGGRMIDNSQTNDPSVTRHQDQHPSAGFITDILSDENGLSIHRFQALIFNLTYGLTFLVEVFSKAHTNGSFPKYDDPVLGLLGLSSGTYIYMKMNESQTTPSIQPASVPPVPAQPTVVSTIQNDELLDVDDNADHSADN